MVTVPEYHQALKIKVYAAKKIPMEIIGYTLTSKVQEAYRGFR
jgi:hypothetical protein